VVIVLVVIASHFSFRTHSEIEEDQRPSSFLDYAKFRHGGSYHDHDVDDIKKLGTILAVFMALVPYWIVYYQVSSCEIRSFCKYSFNILLMYYHACIIIINYVIHYSRIPRISCLFFPLPLSLNNDGSDLCRK